MPTVPVNSLKMIVRYATGMLISELPTNLADDCYLNGHFCDLLPDVAKLIMLIKSITGAIDFSSTLELRIGRIEWWHYDKKMNRKRHTFNS